MGKYDKALYLYLSDNDRFADLFNAVLFDGETVLRGDMLEPDAERHTAAALSGKPFAKAPARLENSFRDIKKRLKSGEGFVVMAVENQSAIDYAMPWRILRLDQMEYGRQIDEIKRRRQAERKARGLSWYRWKERLEKEDRLAPVYTICFYHGVQKWDGPRSLKDMMRFDQSGVVWQKHFHDYGMSLFCANEPTDLARFATELRLLLQVLPLRQNKEALSEVWRGEAFSRLDRDTIETMAIMTDSTEILGKLEDYEEGGGYNMCLAVEEMRRDWKLEGKREGKLEGKAEGKREAVLQILGLYGEIPEKIQQRICSEQNQNIMDKWIQAAVQAGSLENFAKGIGMPLG